MSTRIALAPVLLALLGVSTLHAAETAEIRGHLADAKGGRVYAGEVAVFLCDAKTGYPIDRETREPIKVDLKDQPLERFWHTLTKEDGTYAFSDVLPGKYRIVAQSWSGTKGMPKMPGKTSAFVLLHGTAEDVEVKAGEPTMVVVRQLGNHTLHIKNDPAEAAAILFLSLKPPIGDAILGPYGWGDDFVRHVIGITHMSHPEVMIFGLPPHRDVYATLINFDNSPGLGAGTFKAGEKDGIVRIVAGWSNAHHDPPPELVELTDHVAAHKIVAAEFFGPDEKFKYDFQARHKLAQELLENPERKVSVRTLGERRLADVLAALGYAEFRERSRK